MSQKSPEKPHRYTATSHTDARAAFARAIRPSGAMETFRIRMASNRDDHVAAFTAARCSQDPAGKILELAHHWGIALARCDAEHMVKAYETAAAEDEGMANYDPHVGLNDGGLTQCS